jgi:hypothetical protein
MQASVEALKEQKSTEFELGFLVKRRDSIEALVELAALSIDKKPEDLIDTKLLEGPEEATEGPFIHESDTLFHILTLEREAVASLTIMEIAHAQKIKGRYKEGTNVKFPA